MEVPDSLTERFELFRASARFFQRGKAELFREESWVQVLLGQGLEARYDPMVEMLPDDELAAILREIEEVNADVADAMPDHAEFIARHCKAPSLASVAV
jgi:tryptophan halogenase